MDHNWTTGGGSVGDGGTCPPLKFSVEGTSPLKFRGGRITIEKTKEYERKIKKSSNIVRRQKTNTRPKPTSFRGAQPPLNLNPTSSLSGPPQNFRAFGRPLTWTVGRGLRSAVGQVCTCFTNALYEHALSVGILLERCFDL